ncbi:hypothetical protein TNIN_482451 [Trichonephila inaurata madagascariensis]|uniref:Uncharacterized protein n=1 Tax=Trichonephila inaurata madagascariensis TaxID=2747483 RepID=A0A8X6WRG5_9ARAC|nr:hypothetical protein TNIN_482451 [Trichonephila inaurata madagascariensis]
MLTVIPPTLQRRAVLTLDLSNIKDSTSKSLFTAAFEGFSSEAPVQKYQRLSQRKDWYFSAPHYRDNGILPRAFIFRVLNRRRILMFFTSELDF